ncbi:MAG: tetratricopeptide repeat protein [Planctomycetes bacterium]|nr:tetratricopeptide repeat protein [Planctomycetota bacterium]
MRPTPAQPILRPVVGGALLAALACALAPLGHASQDSSDLIALGAGALARQDYATALRVFNAAAEADPSDAEAAFFQGVALNRLGRYADALARLERAAKGPAPHADLAFETGWALLGLNRWREAAAQLEQFEKAHPGRGQTSEFLGRAFLGLGELDRAEAALKEALRRDPNLAATVRIHLALLEKRRQNAAASREQLEALLREAPATPSGRMVRDELERLARLSATPRRAQKPWHMALSMGGGYDSNVISLGDSTPLPAGISRKHASFLSLGFDASYDVAATTTDTLTVGYGFQMATYDGLASANADSHSLYADYRHSFTSNLIGALRVSDTFTRVDGHSYSNQVAVRPALAVRLADWTVSELSFTCARSNFFTPAPPAQDRDGRSHSLAFVQYFYPRGTKLEARVGVFGTVNRAEGSDFDSRACGLVIGLRHPLFWKIAAEVNCTHTWDRGDHANSLPDASGAFVRRRTRSDSLSVRLTRPFSDVMSVYLGYDYSRADSNISFYDYHRHVCSGGVLFSF